MMGSDSDSPRLSPQSVQRMKGQALYPCVELSLSLGVIGALCLAAAPVGADEVVVARYSTVQAVPTIAQRDPLAGVVTTTFPSAVTRVGQAVTTLLARSGYRLAGAHAAEPGRQMLLELPLPEAHRTLGPTPLRMALETLGGAAFALVEDPVHRLVSFERCEPVREGE